MAPRGDAKLFFCILFITCCFSVTSAELMSDCCLSVKNQSVSKHVIGDYKHQVSGEGCSIDAMVLVGRRGRTLCVPADAPWVKEVLDHVNYLRKVCKKNPKAKRCGGVKLE
uniref:CC chemokine n=1 Tax=Rachycentron canadum TaxID=141264 RepID=G8F0V7_RACCA|nr:CC chemokine [Rachycentron canadum]